MSDNKITFTSSDSGLNNYIFVLEASENTGKTIFAPNQRARLKLYPGGQSPAIVSTNGSSKVSLSGLKQTFTEYLAFRDSAEAKTTYFINTLVSAVWEGAGTGKPIVYGNRLTLKSKTTGVLKVQYETSYDLVDITCSKPTYVLVSAKSEGLEGDFVLDFTDGYQTDVYDKDVILTVRDACSKVTLPNAAIYINERYTGKTDSEGLIRLGSMKSGTYSLKILKDGYQSTDQDNIRNDFFTVE